MTPTTWLVNLVGAVMAVLSVVVHAAMYAPNSFLGQCLDEQWVQDVQTKLKISTTTRDLLLRLDHPHLHAALTKRRFAVNDPRINGKTLNEIFTPKCATSSFTYWGVGAEVDPTTGAITNSGSPDGSLVVEYNRWPSHRMVSQVFSILAQEVLGYSVSMLQPTNSAEMGARMSSASPGLCTPTHVNVEERGTDYSTYANESYKAGIHNYARRAGLYTTRKFVESGAAASKPFSADFWRDYTWNDDLVAALDADLILKNKDYYPPKTSVCPDGVLGCKDSCSKTDTCTAREKSGGKCLGIAFMHLMFDNSRVPAVFANKKIPSYHCYLGVGEMMLYAVEMEAKNVPVLFSHFEPDLFHVIHKNKFTRVFLPPARPELIQADTGKFGEYGYGNKTDNPAAEDFPPDTLSLYAASVLQLHPPVASLISRMTLSELDVNTLLQTYVDFANSTAVGVVWDDLSFRSACSWVRDNYQTWKLWLDRLPLCNPFEHIVYSFHNCNTTKPREIHWAWKEPHPDDPTKPYVCDGGMIQLPPIVHTSKTCAWLAANVFVWYAWTAVLPACDATFYDFNVSDCNAASKRTATYYWLLPDPTNASRSLECRQDGGGEPLPHPVEFACEFAPYASPLPQIVAVIAAVLASVLMMMAVFVVRNRGEPIVKRSQFEFLLVMIAGGIVMCGAAVVYAGEPTYFLCGARPLVTSFGFTLIFGSLVLKSLRVYRVFMSGAMKRVVLSTKTMFKILGVFVLVDALILLAWYVFDFPAPHREPKAIGALAGETVDRHVCLSSSFVFTALLIFWKTIVLFMGLYLSFLIRNVSTDFQESIWIFASSLVVLFGSIIILPMAYLVELPADVFYAFLAFMLLGCTALVMGMMLIPKMLRLKERASESTTIETRGEMTSHNTSDDTRTGGSKLNSLRLGKKAQVAVTPIQEFKSGPQKSKGRPAKPGAANDSSDDE